MRHVSPEWNDNNGQNKGEKEKPKAFPSPVLLSFFQHLV